jgi:hypothetical protein
MGCWQDTGLVIDRAGDGSTFLYKATSSGHYYFATVAVDQAGNVEALPVGNGDTSTFFTYVTPERLRPTR